LLLRESGIVHRFPDMKVVESLEAFFTFIMIADSDLWGEIHRIKQRYCRRRSI